VSSFLTQQRVWKRSFLPHPWCSLHFECAKQRSASKGRIDDLSRRARRTPSATRTIMATPEMFVAAVRALHGPDAGQRAEADKWLTELRASRDVSCGVAVTVLARPGSADVAFHAASLLLHRCKADWSRLSDAEREHVASTVRCVVCREDGEHRYSRPAKTAPLAQSLTHIAWHAPLLALNTL
jgi:hypothetical protein